jgi:hypothetical protein
LAITLVAIAAISVLSVIALKKKGIIKLGKGGKE